VNAIEIAIKMETDAIDFYTKAAGRVKNKVGQNTFLSIAGDETRHRGRRDALGVGQVQSSR